MTMKLLNLKSIKRILFGYFDRLEKSATDSREKVFYLTSKIRKKRHYIHNSMAKPKKAKIPSVAILLSN